METAPDPCLVVTWATTRGCGFSKDRRYAEGWGNGYLNTAKGLMFPKGPIYTRLPHNTKLWQSTLIGKSSTISNLLWVESEAGTHQVILVTGEEK